MRMTVNDPIDVQDFLIEHGNLKLTISRTEEENTVSLTSDTITEKLALQDLEVLGNFLIGIASNCYGTTSKSKITLD